MSVCSLGRLFDGFDGLIAWLILCISTVGLVDLLVRSSFFGNPERSQEGEVIVELV